MPARLTCYLPDRAAQVRVLADAGVVRLGRDPECEILVDHPSVSRAHAQIDGGPSPPELLDLGSKNGSFVDGVRVSRRALGEDCWLRFGDVYCEFECLSAAQARALEQQASRRRATSAVLQRQAAAQPRFDLVLEETLRAAAELAGCERGFLLLGDPGSMRVRCAIGLDRGAPGAAAFDGSSAAVTRALETGQPVFANDTGSAPWLRERASVVGGGIRALACVPLRDGGSAIGALYLDSRRASARITELDAELLVEFVERMALAIAVRRAGEDLGSLAAGTTRPDDGDRTPVAPA